MDLRSLRYLVSLEEKGSFTAAAKEHFVTQPAISIQLRKLQEEAGSRLYEVKGRKVRFTEAGRTVLQYARKYLDLDRQLVRELEDLRGVRSGKLFLGTIDAASIYVLPKVFSTFNRLYPGIEVNLEISSTMPLLRDLEEGKLDLVVGSLPEERLEGIDVFPVYSERLVPIAPPGHVLASGKKIDPKMLKDHPFISFQEESVTRRIIEKALAKKGVSLRITMAIDSQEAIRNLVASGFGLSILPEETVGEYIREGTVERLDIKGLKMKRELALMVPSGRYISATVRAFLKIVKEGLGIRLPASLCEDPGGKK